ncbi:hypothetical protein [Dyadobacter sp. CY356]|uniref:hypothetical protein n=1 Tax=Dyadobacter sp. CY356 TaxID=2906442 RepID=UPI001F221439|nr:hypothetical protein [Dyadobacter sp. CY356]MCF0055504.1 hypothetical protein [Dyadobacter sp. CY356]
MPKNHKGVNVEFSSSAKKTTKGAGVATMSPSTKHVGPLPPSRGASYQVKNPLTGNYIMKEASTGKFVASSNGKKFSGVTVKKTISAAPNPHIDKVMAANAEKDMLEVLNKSK